MIYQETILLLEQDCPSLSDLRAGDIALHLRFDSDTTAAVRGVLFSNTIFTKMVKDETLMRDERIMTEDEETRSDAWDTC